MPRDLSQQAGNPTHGIEQHYTRLMDIQDPDLLQQEAMSIVQSYAESGGISERNLRKFNFTMQKLSGNLPKIQQYLTNFLLAGSGLAVESNEMAAVVSFITESTDPIKLTVRQVRLKLLVESCGYKVRLAQR